MPQHKILQLREEAVVNMQIRPADRGGSHPKDNVARIFDFRIFDIVHFDVTWPVKNQRFHDSFPFIQRIRPGAVDEA